MREEEKEKNEFSQDRSETEQKRKKAMTKMYDGRKK